MGLPVTVIDGLHGYRAQGGPPGLGPGHW